MSDRDTFIKEYENTRLRKITSPTGRKIKADTPYAKNLYLENNGNPNKVRTKSLLSPKKSSGKDTEKTLQEQTKDSYIKEYETSTSDYIIGLNGRKILINGATAKKRYLEYGGDPKNVRGVSKPKVSPKRNSNVSPKRNSKVSPKRNSKVSPKRNSKVSPKRTSKVSPKRTSKVSPKRTSKLSPKRTSKLSPKRTSKLSPKRTSKPIETDYEKITYEEDYSDKFIEVREKSNARRITSPITKRPILRVGPASDKIYNEIIENKGNLQRIPKRFQRNWTEKEIQTRATKRGGALAMNDRMKFDKTFNHKGLWDHRKLSKTDRQIYLMNPHIRQVYASFQNIRMMNRPLDDRDRIVSNDFPREKYRSRRYEWKTVDHWGQRKLLMSEIEFLTRFDAPGRVVVYAGAAPGEHTNFLADMFPDLEFHLVDPAPFSATETDRIKIFNEYFTDDVARRYDNDEYKDRVLLISDIRSWDKDTKPEDKEGRVVIDMNWQKDWADIIQPIATMFKFRLPYENGKTMYYDGDIYLPVWGGRTTSEARLVSVRQNSGVSFPLKEYDNAEYEDIMFAFNTVVRTSYYEVDSRYLEMDIGYDHCFDCASEIHIIEQYLYQCKNIKPKTVRGLKQFEKLASNISSQCSNSGRTLKLRFNLAHNKTLRKHAGMPVRYNKGEYSPKY